MQTQDSMPQPPAAIRNYGITEYADAWLRMRNFTDERTAETLDEIWLTFHPPVYTLGQAGKPEHLLRATSIPVVKSDRGGQITYHGPGQPVIYLLFDLSRAKIKIRQLVRGIEQAVIDELHGYGIVAHRRPRMPGIYVADAKIAAVGLRVRKGCTYHGLSLNVDCDLEPFTAINTCGYPQLVDTSLQQLGCEIPAEQVAAQLAARLSVQLYQNCYN